MIAVGNQTGRLRKAHLEQLCLPLSKHWFTTTPKRAQVEEARRVACALHHALPRSGRGAEEEIGVWRGLIAGCNQFPRGDFLVRAAEKRRLEPLVAFERLAHPSTKAPQSALPAAPIQACALGLAGSTDENFSRSVQPLTTC